jgi:hypothetical protein
MDTKNDGMQETLRDMEAARQAKAARQTQDKVTLIKLNQVMDYMFITKPNDRSELDRRYAIAKTEFEKLYAYVKVFIVDWDGA